MRRREFLKRAGLAGAALAASGAGGWPPQASMKKAVKLQMVEGMGTTLEKFALLKEIGFDGVELSSPNDLSRQEVLEAKEQTGLPVHGVVDSVHWNKTLSDPDARVREEGEAGLREALADAEAYGASTVLLVPAVVREEVPYDAAYERSQAEIRKVLPEAAQRGITIALENVWNDFLLSPLEFARYIDELESEWVGAYFDIGNIANYGWPAQWIRILGDRIVKLDVKGYSRARRDEAGPRAGFQVEIGGGDIDWEAVRAALRDVDYDGWATAEVPGGGSERLRRIAQNMNRVLPVG